MKGPGLASLIAVAGLLTFGGVARSENCAYDRAAMLAMDFDRFDQDASGWRSIGQAPGCFLAGAGLIADYRKVHPNLSLSQADGLRWHEGQLRAMVGDTQGAIPLLAASNHDDDSANQAYIDATLAFLRQDRPALIAARRRLAGLPRPADFQAGADAFKAQTGRGLTWPLNLDVVDRLLACFDRPYAEAYGGACNTVR
ncbi:hypothetical protein [Caulobacter sp. UNC279MFTsu5.1]|uniref:hypothetical protein n=1 Tax=Caulobacter sp. UNC279MFTsu5.1 TaxID=1502775 RepID=UPI0021011494|nr:hypothetical protein [Caulobacter sp. UNC279MFTsu5.1]